MKESPKRQQVLHLAGILVGLGALLLGLWEAQLILALLGVSVVAQGILMMFLQRKLCSLDAEHPDPFAKGDRRDMDPKL